MIVHDTPSAARDILDIASAIEDDRRGYGEKVLDASRAVLENIERFPRMYSPAEDGLPGREVRNALLGRFKYRVIYLVREADAVILAVVHLKRHDASWQGRLSDVD